VQPHRSAIVRSYVESEGTGTGPSEDGSNAGGGAWAWLLAGWLLAAVRVPASSSVGDDDGMRARIPEREAQRHAPIELARLSPRELRSLPGIGESRALAIARECWERGRLDVGELDSVPSIGEGTVERVRAWIERAEGTIQ
jgi:hypothetical protein